MIVDVARTKTYIPKFRGNDKLQSGEQVVVTYPWISATRRAQLLPRPEYRVKSDENGNPEGGEAIIKLDDRALITGMKPKISNFGYHETGMEDEKKIENANELYDAPSEIVDELIAELADHFRKELRKVADEKN